MTLPACNPTGNGMNMIFQRVMWEIRDCDSVLDIGCGTGEYLRAIKLMRPDIRAIGLDPHEVSLDQSGADAKILGAAPAKLYDLDVKSVDAVLCLDVIEHMPKRDAIETLLLLKSIARKVVVVFTPRGLMPQPPAPDNPWQEHLCGFEEWELSSLGLACETWPSFDYGKAQHDALWAIGYP